MYTGEPPAWLISLVDQRMALVEESIGKMLPTSLPTIVMTPLAEKPDVVSFERWNRTCDCCDSYCPDSAAFYAGHITRQLRNGIPVNMTFGVCEACKKAMT